jgi:hypothetical protein
MHPMPESPFASLERLRSAFVAGLEALLADEGLGAYILVLANASFDADLMALLKDRLNRRFDEHLLRCRNQLAAGHEPEEAADDLLVFLKLATLGLDAVGTTEVRQSGPWEVQFNLLRAFRPKRLSQSLVRGIQVPFASKGFHFNKGFLRRETFWSGRLGRFNVDLLYNKFPFVDLHGLLVPDREAEHPQFLARPYHDFIWGATEELGAAVPGLGLGYNSFGAYASVNHLHFQTFVRRRPLPLMDPRWRHNGGSRDYPAPCVVFDRMGDAWNYLDHLHREETPYNLVYLPGRVYCLPRARQGDYRHASWTAGFAWYEMAGGMIAFDRADYEGLAPGAIETELRRVGIMD